MSSEAKAMPSGSSLVVQGLDAQPIASEQQLLRFGVPRGEREHPDQTVQAGAAVLRQEMHENFGVAGRLPWSRQTGAQLSVVVELSVISQDLGIEGHGLVTTLG